jgi:phosphoserine phosphatase RsbU/P
MSEQSKIEKLLLHAARMLNSTLEYEELMKLVLELTIKATDAQAAMVYRIDNRDDFARARFLIADNGDVKHFKFGKGEGLIGWVADKRESIISNDVQTDPRYCSDIENHTNFTPCMALAVPLIGRGQMIGVVEALNKRNGGFDDADLDTLVGLANQFAVTIDNANLYRTAKREARERELLYEVSKTLSSTLNIDEVLKQIISSIRQVVDCSAGSVFLINEEKGEISTVYAEGYQDTSDQFVQLKIGQGIIGWAAKNGETVVVPDVTEDERYVTSNHDTLSEMAVPIKIGPRVIGVLNIESTRKNVYDSHSVDLVTVFASHAAVTIERAMMHDSMLKNKGLEEQLAIARHIQVTFLPENDPVHEGYDISGVNIPSGDVGGDYYDFIRIVDNQTGIAIADVSGKGIPAALIMASFRASLIAEIRNNYAIRTICKKVNALLYESLERENYVTAFYGVLDSKNDIFTFSNCGHNQPILLHKDNRVELLQEGGVALGVIPEADYEERPILLHSGDVLLMYTDGVTEAENSDGRQFGNDRLIEAMKECRNRSAREIFQTIYDKVRVFASTDHVFDDLTMVVVKKL